MLIDKCLAQCNDDIFKTKVRSDALINGLTTRYLRISAKMSLDILSISDYKEVVSKYLSLITKDREPGITLGVLLFQYVSFLYDIMWEDVAYVSLILFTLHELSLRAYDASNNVLHDILAEFSVDSEQEALAEAYNTQLESLLKRAPGYPCDDWTTNRSVEKPGTSIITCADRWYKLSSRARTAKESKAI